MNPNRAPGFREMKTNRKMKMLSVAYISKQHFSEDCGSRTSVIFRIFSFYHLTWQCQSSKLSTRIFLLLGDVAATSSGEFGVNRSATDNLVDADTVVVQNNGQLLFSCLGSRSQGEKPETMLMEQTAVPIMDRRMPAHNGIFCCERGWVTAKL